MVQTKKIFQRLYDKSCYRRSSKDFSIIFTLPRSFSTPLLHMKPLISFRKITLTRGTCHTPGLFIDIVTIKHLKWTGQTQFLVNQKAKNEQKEIWDLRWITIKASRLRACTFSAYWEARNWTHVLSAVIYLYLQHESVSLPLRDNAGHPSPSADWSVRKSEKSCCWYWSVYMSNTFIYV